MAMNFFEHQDHARRRTGRLVVYFAMAVICIVLVLYATGIVLLNWAQQSASNSSQNQYQSQVQTEIVYWNWEVFFGVVCLSGLIIGGGSLFRIHQLSGGGNVVAESLGGTLLDPGTVRGDERKLLNVVEEMAIASGVPVPPVYLIDDDSINAFAAGFKSTDAVIGVTRGCMQKLDREQLQGVIAHEFSHIFNGDMRLNIRLIGVIYGLLVMGLIGLYVLRAMAITGGGRRSSGGKKDNSAAFIMIFAAVMMLLGFVGTFFGRLIQASVSRQREFLADASAVQYTRNPNGIAGALRAIGGMPVKNDMGPRAGEYNHMFFAQAMNSVFASHPPVQERVARIEQVPVESVEAPTHSTGASAPSSAAVSGFAGSVSTAQLHHAVDSIGTVNAGAVANATGVLKSLPADLVDAAHATWSARLIVLGILLDPTAKGRLQQLNRLESKLDSKHHEALNVLESSTRTLHPVQKLPLIDLCIPALAQLSKPQYDEFMQVVQDVIKADGQITLLEWTVYTVLEKHLGERFDAASRKHPGTKSIRALRNEAVQVLATVAYLGQDEVSDVQSAYADGLSVLRLDERLPDAARCTLRTLRQSLHRLAALRYADRQKLLKAISACIDHDGHTTIEEAQLLRGIADSIDCPMPPILPEPAAA